MPWAAIGLPRAGQPTALATLTVGSHAFCGAGSTGDGPKLRSAVTASCGSLQAASGSASAPIQIANRIVLRMVAPGLSRPTMPRTITQVGGNKGFGDGDDRDHRRRARSAMAEMAQCRRTLSWLFYRPYSHR